jgi:hypothetical protein
MATQRPTTPYVASPLAAFADRLFTAGDYTSSGMTSSNILEWKIPLHIERDEDLRDWGTRMAAAHAIMLGKLGEACEPNFRGFIEDEEFLKNLQNKERRGHSAASHYIQQIQSYLWALGQLVSPKQIADDAEARIIEYKNIDAEDSVFRENQQKP